MHDLQQDAVMMNGTNRVIADISTMIDKLAMRLAKLKYQVEQKVDIAVNAGYVSVSPDGDATEVTAVPGKPVAVCNALDSLITRARGSSVFRPNREPRCPSPTSSRISLNSPS